MPFVYDDDHIIFGNIVIERPFHMDLNQWKIIVEDFDHSYDWTWMLVKDIKHFTECRVAAELKRGM